MVLPKSLSHQLWSKYCRKQANFLNTAGGLGYLYLDGKLLELLSIYLGEVLELDILMGKNISMSRTERTAIMEAKRIIDSQLAFAPLVKNCLNRYI